MSDRGKGRLRRKESRGREREGVRRLKRARLRGLMGRSGEMGAQRGTFLFKPHYPDRIRDENFLFRQWF